MRLVLLAALAATLFAMQTVEAAKLRRLPIGAYGALELTAPDEWVTAPGSAAADPELLLKVPAHEFLMRVVARPLPGVTGSAALERIRAAVERLAAASEITDAAESPPVIQEIRGPRAAGYYFTITDKNWKQVPGDYHYLTEGSMVVGTLAVGFRILSNAEADREPALDVLRSAAHAAR